MGNVTPTGHPWAADTGCFRRQWQFDPNRYLGWLSRQDAKAALFAVAPDVPYNMAATLRQSRPWFEPIRRLCYAAALAVQNGADADKLPWDEFDVLFIGGDDDFKRGRASEDLCVAAKELGKPIHMARVNGGARATIAKHRGAASVDGTILAFGRDVNLPKVKEWLAFLNRQASFF